MPFLDRFSLLCKTILFEIVIVEPPRVIVGGVAIPHLGDCSLSLFQQVMGPHLAEHYG
ncbi:MAG: hypothetical protein U5K69_29245 [Balneolaceae bacterium]|nr:hypothetical protein [Balneolaceae bacterium]